MVLRKKVKRLAIQLARLGHPKPWRWARKLMTGFYVDLFDDIWDGSSNGWKLLEETYYCRSCEEQHTEVVGVISPEGRRFLVDWKHGRLQEV